MSCEEIVISAKGLGKSYPLFDTRRDRLRYAMGVGRERVPAFWALKSFDFEVARGESVGLVGRNGSGKSTALALIAGTLAPTKGEVEVRGRVAPILGLGVGFNPEFSGRENAEINASILGAAEHEIRSAIPSIEEFAGIGEFFGRPVRTYSNGMRARLAFAVAIHTRPDILLIDEVLAVGDEAFKRRCFAKIDELKTSGVTTVFVSHSSNLVVELCDRAVLLERGEAVLSGDPKEVVARYQQLLYASPAQIPAIVEGFRRGGDPQDPASPRVGTAVATASRVGRLDPDLRPLTTFAYESRGARIEDARIRDSRGEPVNIAPQSAPLWFEYSVVFDRDAIGVRFGMLIKLASGVEIGGQVSHPPTAEAPTIAAGTRARVRFSLRGALSPGTYFLNAGVRAKGDEGEDFIHRVIDVAILRVEAGDPTRVTGIVDLIEDDAELSFESVADVSAATAAVGG